MAYRKMVVTVARANSSLPTLAEVMATTISLVQGKPEHAWFVSIPTTHIRTLDWDWDAPGLSEHLLIVPSLIMSA